MWVVVYKLIRNKIGHKLTLKKIQWPQTDAATRFAKRKYFLLLQWIRITWKFILHLKRALNLFYSRSIIYEYLTWLQTGAFTLLKNIIFLLGKTVESIFDFDFFFLNYLLYHHIRSTLKSTWDLLVILYSSNTVIF